MLVGHRFTTASFGVLNRFTIAHESGTQFLAAPPQQQQQSGGDDDAADDGAGHLAECVWLAPFKRYTIVEVGGDVGGGDLVVRSSAPSLLQVVELDDGDDDGDDAADDAADGAATGSGQAPPPPPPGTRPAGAARRRRFVIRRSEGKLSTSFAHSRTLRTASQPGAAPFTSGGPTLHLRRRWARKHERPTPLSNS